MPSGFTPVDLHNPVQFKAAVQNIHNLYNATPEQVRRTGAQWYDRVHEATAKGVRNRGLSVRQGAGMVAAVSPNMDWERNNIGAFKELTSLTGHHWTAIAASAAAGGGRSSEARRVLQGLSISTSTDAGLMKAHRIMQGEDNDVVLSRRTAPKTNAFAHNIEHPDVAGHVTIDGRAHDIAANRLQPWTSSRGINSAALVTGKTTRYEHFENAYRAATQSIAEQHDHLLLPHQLQAVTWEGGKMMERAGVTKSGKPRKVGVARTGQPYL